MEVVVKHTVPPRSVEWKGRTYLPGETIPDLPKEEAERLFGLGLIEGAGKKGTVNKGRKEEGEKDGGKTEKDE